MFGFNYFFINIFTHIYSFLNLRLLEEHNLQDCSCCSSWCWSLS